MTGVIHDEKRRRKIDALVNDLMALCSKDRDAMCCGERDEHNKKKLTMKRELLNLCYGGFYEGQDSTRPS